MREKFRIGWACFNGKQLYTISRGPALGAPNSTHTPHTHIFPISDVVPKRHKHTFRRTRSTGFDPTTDTRTLDGAAAVSRSLPPSPLSSLSAMACTRTCSRLIVASVRYFLRNVELWGDDKSLETVAGVAVTVRWLHRLS